MRINFRYDSSDSYRQFLQVRKCPLYRFQGGTAIVPDEYSELFGMDRILVESGRYDPMPWLFDYQRDISSIAGRKRKYAVFAECGLGKTFIILEFARQCLSQTSGKFMLVSPLMVCDQTCEEAEKWYGGNLDIGQVRASQLSSWLTSKGGPMIGVTNYEAIREGLPHGHLSGIALDESSYLKSAYGAWGLRLIELGRGVPWKLCATVTPAPNDRIEFANHAVFLDRAKTVNEFLATYFVNRGETQNRWELKPHAIKPFYRHLADWSIFLSNPSVYGWKDNVSDIPPIHVHIEHVDLTDDQMIAARGVTGQLFASSVGKLGDRGKLSQIAKGKGGIAENKSSFIRSLVDRWIGTESTIIWCNYNEEQDKMARTFPEFVSIDGSTPESDRKIAIDRFKNREVPGLISKPKIMGFGLNLQVCTRQVFSGIKDCYDTVLDRVGNLGNRRC